MFDIEAAKEFFKLFGLPGVVVLGAFWVVKFALAKFDEERKDFLAREEALAKDVKEDRNRFLDVLERQRLSIDGLASRISELGTDHKILTEKVKDLNVAVDKIEDRIEKR